tara:strand:+ start:3753 stop:4391 length:639 start_codon:yes stop_codon:yes gene_type:complete
MKEVTQMWILVRLLYKNRFILAISATREDGDRRHKERIHELSMQELENLSLEKLSATEQDEQIDNIVEKVKSELASVHDHFRDSYFYEYNKEARVKRHDLEELYLSRHVEETNIFSIEDEKDKDKIRFMRIEFNSILESCISNGYVDKDDKEIFLTNEGKKFASIGGLVRIYGREMGEFINDWKIVVITIVALVGAIKWELILYWLRDLFGI